MPTYTPRRIKDEMNLPDDVVATFEGEYAFVKLGGIDWRVLTVEKNKALLISEKITEERFYNNEHKNVTWETCTLRGYLNGEFLSKLGAVKFAIAETRNINPNNPWYGTAGGNTTTDKVFLLSLDEVCRYFGDSTENLKKRGNIDNYLIFDQNNSARRVKYGSEGVPSGWWLRTPGYLHYYTSVVSSGGEVNVFGSFVSERPGGVRPALWLNL